MTAQPTTTITTRRALLAGALGAAAASVAGSFARPHEARATDGGAIQLGRSPSGTIDGTGMNEATTTTRIKTAGNDGFSVETGDTGYSAIFGLNSATTSNGRGVFGRSDGSTGVGVWGHAAHTTGTTKGVYGSSSSSAGVGVHGVAPNTTGPTKGVYGSSSSSAGVGVHGVAPNSAGSGVGVVGESAGSVGQGVRAVSTAPTGYAYALYARSMSDQGAAVLAQSQANSGVCYGVFGQVQSPHGTGVVGHAGAATGATHGVLGRSFSPDGFGTVGHSVADGTGVLGLTGPLSSMLPAPVAKTAVYGRATQDSGSRGVYGYSTAGQGVRGQATTGTAGHFSTPQSDGIHRGTALRAVGRVRFDRCAGIATIVSGANSVTVTPGIDLVSTSAVVATLQGSAGGVTTVHRVAVNATANTFTILLTANSSANVKVAWHVFG